MIFLKQPADPFDCVDPSWEVRRDDYSETGIEIQDASAYLGRYCVNEYSGEGDSFSMRTLAMLPTLKAAKAFALTHLSAE